VIREPATVALTLHAGRAVTVVLTGTRRDPKMILRHEIDLADPWVRESRHPYHQALGARTTDGERAQARGCRAARASAGREVRQLVRDMKAHGLDPRGAAVVVANLVDPALIAGAHARAHAEEETLYRDVVVHTLATSGITVTIRREATLRSEVAKHLGHDDIDRMLKTLARAVGTPWRAAEKHASLAAWLALPSRAGGLNVRGAR
jgi:tRNA pseudouridine-54 N-methylase